MSAPIRPRSAGARRIPLWQAVCAAGLADSEVRARALVLAGQVLVDDRPVDKPGTPVPPDSALRVRGVRAYASRGGHKLEAALRAFAISAEGRVALDAGASTGGFTDCLLQHGAARVYSVDVGYGQLLGRLRQDPRVVNLERTNLGSITSQTLTPPPSLVTLDLSYLALDKAWRLVGQWLPPGGEIVSLVKPLFEVDDAEARRTGRITSDAAYGDLLRRLLRAAETLGWSPRGLMASPIRGNHATLEFLLHLRAEAGCDRPIDPEAVVREALNSASEAPVRP